MSNVTVYTNNRVGAFSFFAVRFLSLAFCIAGDAGFVTLDDTSMMMSAQYLKTNLLSRSTMV